MRARRSIACANSSTRCSASMASGTRKKCCLSASTKFGCSMPPDSRTARASGPEQFDALPAETQARIQGIKLFTDGAIGVSTAALHEPYRTTHGTGLLLYADPELDAIIRRYAGTKPFAIHAIGDRAIDQVVAVVERVGRDARVTPDVRIEHAQLISRATATRAKALGIHLSMQPNFSDDSIAYEDRLPLGYPERNNPLRMLIDDVGYVCGRDLHFGSDGMPHGVHEALRQSLFPRHDGQRLTMDEFVAGYCLPDLGAGRIDVDVDGSR